MNFGKPILFSTSRYAYLMAQMLSSKRFQKGELARSINKDGTPSYDDVPFADGERYHRFLTDKVDLVDREVVIVGGTVDDRETMELLDLAAGAVLEGALRLKLVIPYFGYSTMERAVNAGEIVKAKLRAMQISAIPRASLGNWVYLCDLHSEGTPSFFENGVKSKHIYAKKLIIDAIAAAAEAWQSEKSVKLETPAQSHEAEDGSLDLQVRKVTCRAPDVDKLLEEHAPNDVELADFTVASTDAGRAKWVESLCRDMAARHIPVHPAFIIKRRVSGSQTEVADISAEVDGKLVVIYDDMIRTGGSAIGAARAYRQRGAADVILVSTHGILPGESLEKLRKSTMFHKVIVTDTHPHAHELADEFLTVVPTGALFVENVLNGKAKSQI